MVRQVLQRAPQNVRPKDAPRNSHRSGKHTKSIKTKPGRAGSENVPLPNPEDLDEATKLATRRKPIPPPRTRACIRAGGRPPPIVPLIRIEPSRNERLKALKNPNRGRVPSVSKEKVEQPKVGRPASLPPKQDDVSHLEPPKGESSRHEGGGSDTNESEHQSADMHMATFWGETTRKRDFESRVEDLEASSLDSLFDEVAKR